MPIYTKKGDSGYTSILPGTSERKKSNEIFEVLGNIDELNASLGFLQFSQIKTIQTLVLKLQNDLFILGTVVADESESAFNQEYWDEEILRLEEEIEHLDASLSKLKNFVLPGGSKEAAHLHLSRTICRRLERVFVKYMFSDGRNDLRTLMKYINRLSDMLFVMARYSNNMLGIKDAVWKVNNTNL